MNLSEKQKQGSGPRIVLVLIVSGICLFINHRCKVVAKIQADEQRKEQAARIESERADRTKAAEHARKFETPITAEGVPDRVEALMKQQLGDRFVSSSANYDKKEKGWKISVEGKVVLADRGMIEHEMIELLSTSAPAGMTVSSFAMSYFADFTDGLGHKSLQPLVKCSTHPGIMPKIDWGNRGVDLWSLKFDKIFTTDYCHPSFTSKWSNTKE